MRHLALLLLTLITACSDDAGDVSKLPGPDASVNSKADVPNPRVADMGVADAGDTFDGRAEIATPVGPIVGMSGAVWSFKGVPYARAGRWERPQAVAWTEPLDATRFGAVCPQLGNTPSQPHVSWGPQPPACQTCTDDGCRAFCWDEDCQNLNVWTPDVQGARPVMVWLHGGSYIYGAGSLYDGARLSQRGDVVVVTLNYRLGALGMFAHPELAESLNFGMLDEIAALGWVRQNIASFGGDPDNVTIFGESAGGASVCALMTSDASNGLFDAAIMQSGSCSWYPRPKPLQTSYCAGFEGCPDLATMASENLYNCVSMECLGQRVGEVLECSDASDKLACLRSKDPLDVLRALPQNIGLQGGVLWERFLDGETMTRAPGAAFYTGDFRRVPFVLGTTRDEANIFHLPSGPTVDTVAEFDAYVGLWGACADEIAATYPVAEDRDARQAYLRLQSDYFYTCPTNWIAQSAAYHSPDVWLYEFTHVPWAGTLDLSGDGFRLGAYHSAELPFVFANVVSPDVDANCVPDADGDYLCCTQDGLLCFDREDASFSDELVRRWTSVAKEHIPGTGWPRYTVDARQHLQLEPTARLGEHLAADACETWLAVRSHFEQGSGVCDPR